ncbi:phosphomannomutase [Methylobacterium sp. WL103]|uniref:TadE/TadG family type IV pilus assembly protein n=1 Tax=unclassified Methylobacterium TaxID=2615210 RepID=UPI0011C78525|nr:MULTISPECIES: pilus assembly protein TadG-related protein [unclassified Methylobacterium]TXM74288.1 phosphomannomutase [Methylobacterium sp. WL12]TXN03514.1 phosphomannomutase [Methylobacterium sp. WL103]
MSWLLTNLRRVGRPSASRPSFAAARDGNIAMIFGLSLIPMIGLIGLGVDYGVSMTNKTKLDNAADAAAVAAVATAKAYIAANQGQANLTAKAIAAGINQATNIFNVNAGTVPYATYTLQTPQLVSSGQTLTSTVAYTATVTNNFGRIFRAPTTNLANTVTASTDLASYLDFYLMVDVSGSMGLPTSTKDMKRLADINIESDSSQGCMFACHFPSKNGWNKAVNAKPQIQLRSDSVNNAVCLLLQRAANQLVPNQYRVGIYPFINQLATLSPLSSNLATASTAADCAKTWPMALTNLLDTNTTQLSINGDPSTGTGSGGTHFEVALPQMKSAISAFGDGSSTGNPKPFLFLITDGMQNGQHYYVSKNGKYTYPGNPSKFSGYANADWDGSSPAKIDPANCSALKTAGATISILYIPYIFINSPDDGSYTAGENTRVNGISPTLATPLKSCASPGYFFTANTSDDIATALSTMFDRAVKMTRLTQ